MKRVVRSVSGSTLMFSSVTPRVSAAMVLPRAVRDATVAGTGGWLGVPGVCRVGIQGGMEGGAYPGGI